MKKLISILILVAIAAAFAEVKFGMKMRVRSELQNLNSTDADAQIYDKKVDFRFRPYVGYVLNDKLCVKAVFEIGDIQFGTNPHADLGTDGINTETKNLYVDIKPNKDHKITLGLMPYKDPHSFIFDADVAGILWQGQFNKYDVDLGWFAPADFDEENLDGDNYSYGTTFFAFDLGYDLNKNIDIGIANYLVFDREHYTTTVNRDLVSIYVAPRVSGTYGKVKFDAQLVINNRYTDYDVVQGEEDFIQPHDPDKTGTGLSLKSVFTVDKKTSVRANLIYRGCQTMYENFEHYNAFYDTGLEIINQNPVGIAKVDPMEHDENGIEGFQELGVVLPAVLVDYKLKDNVILTGGMGVFVYDQNYAKVHDAWIIGTEFDLKSKITLYEQLDLIPYAAFFIPDVGYARIMGELDENGYPNEDPIFKIGATVKYAF